MARLPEMSTWAASAAHDRRTADATTPAPKTSTVSSGDTTVPVSRIRIAGTATAAVTPSGRHIDETGRAKRLDARDRRLQVRLPEVRVPPIRLGPAARERQRAGQASLVERDPGDDRHSELPAGREELVLRRLVEDVVGDLDRVDEARPERAEAVGGLP